MIELSKLDKMKGMRIPSEVNADLAYICGVLVGDGHLSYRPDKHDHCVKCVGHPVDEKDFYDDVVVPKIKVVFGINIIPKLRDQGTTYGIQFHSKSIVIYLNQMIGIPIGAKSSIIEIPDMFKSDDLLMKSFIRGYADTDFCLALKRRYKEYQYYPVIVGASKSRNIMEQVASYLESKGFRVTRDFDRAVYDERFGKSITVHRIQLDGHMNLVHWMETVGFESPKHLRKFELWKERNRENAWARTAIARVGFSAHDMRI